MKINDALLAAFAPYRNVCSLGDVAVRNVPAPLNALDILKKMGLNVSNQIVVAEFESPYWRYDWDGAKKEKFISSYHFLEAGTENQKNQNNLATYNPTMNTLTIHYHDGKDHVGRGHWIGYAKKIWTVG